MNYIKIASNENGTHNNQFGGAYPGEGWAIIPDNFLLPSTFPYVSIEIEDGIVVSMQEQELPTPEPHEEVPSLEEMVLSILADQEERICLLELGVNNIQ